ncbi:uncharacterized protein LOC107370469 [Tetranychus urticae]|uniref:uncharacterized protein LOC107370469 n=1 Tax=Tetranychus urticae TaxID=32264 RepID=UPI00077BC4A8|nr:uncharacterized protein LOC107370469 [Tetranychus urticae]
MSTISPDRPGRSLLLASLSLSNPIPALIAASLYSNSENESVYSIFDCFCCWLHSSFSLDFKPRSPSSYNSIIWNQQDFNAMIQNALQVSSNFLVFRNGLRIFAAPNNPLSDLIQYFIEFLVEKDYYDSVKKLKTFQECLWNYKKDQDDRGLLSSKAWIEETSIIILSNGLKAVDCEFELNILLRHLDFARLQSSFDEQTSVPDFRKLYRLSQCLQDTDLKLSIPDLLSTQSGTKKYNDSILEVVYSLQDKGFTARLNKFRNSVESELIKAFIHAKDFYYATRLECDPVETTINEIDLWSTVISLEMNSINPDELIDWTDIWENILDICKSIVPEGQATKLPTIINEKARLSEEKANTLKVIIGKILNVGKIDLAYRLSHLFFLKSRDLLLINFCNLLADGFFAHVCPKSYIETRAKDYGFTGLNEVVQMLNDFSPTVPSNVVKILEKCSSLSEHAVNACQRIVLYYKISFVIERSYLDLSRERDELAILSELIKRSSSNVDALPYARELITFAKIGG